MSTERTVENATLLLRECLHHLNLHNEEYSHRTPADLMRRVDEFIRWERPLLDPSLTLTFGAVTPNPAVAAWYRGAAHHIEAVQQAKKARDGNQSQDPETPAA